MHSLRRSINIRLIGPTVPRYLLYRPTVCIVYVNIEELHFAIYVLKAELVLKLF